MTDGPTQTVHGFYVRAQALTLYKNHCTCAWNSGLPAMHQKTCAGAQIHHTSIQLSPSVSAMLLTSILLHPLTSRCIMLGPVLDVSLCDFWHQWVTWVWICEQGRHRKQNFGDGQGWTPLVLQDVETDCTVGIDIAVVNLRCEVHFGWLEGIVCWKMDVQEENASSVWAIRWSHDCCLP